LGRPKRGLEEGKKMDLEGNSVWKGIIWLRIEFSGGLFRIPV